MNVSCCSKRLDALGPEFFDDAGEEHAVQTGLTGADEFVGAAVANKNTISRRQFELVKTFGIDRRIGLDQAYVAGKDLGVEEPGKRRTRPGGDLRGICIGDEPQAHSATAQIRKQLKIAGGNCVEGAFETLLSDCSGLGKELVRNVGNDAPRDRTNNFSGIANLRRSGASVNLLSMPDSNRRDQCQEYRRSKEGSTTLTLARSKCGTDRR